MFFQLLFTVKFNIYDYQGKKLIFITSLIIRLALYGSLIIYELLNICVALNIHLNNLTINLLKIKDKNNLYYTVAYYL